MYRERNLNERYMYRLTENRRRSLRILQWDLREIAPREARQAQIGIPGHYQYSRNQ